MELEKKYEQGVKLASNDLPSSEELFNAMGIVPSYDKPFSGPVNTGSPQGLAPDKNIAATPVQENPVTDAMTGVQKSAGKTLENALNSPANTWNMLMEVGAYNEKMLTGKDATAFYQDKKAATLDFGIPAPQNDSEQMGYEAANFVTQIGGAVAGYGIAGGNFLATSAVSSFINTLNSNPQDPKIVSQALKLAGQHFDGSPVFGPIADSITSLGHKLDNPDANPDVQRLYGLMDYMIQDATILAGSKLAIKAVGAAVEHVPQAVNILKSERGAIGEGPKPPGSPKDISIKVDPNTFEAVPEKIRNEIENFDISKISKQNENQANLGPTAKVAPVEAAVQRSLESKATADAKLPAMDLSEESKKGLELWSNQEEFSKVLQKKEGFTKTERIAIQFERKASSYKLVQDMENVLKDPTPENSVAFKEQFMHATKVKILDGQGASLSGQLLSLEQASFRGTLAGSLENYLTMSGGKENVVEMAKELKDIIDSVGSVDGALSKVARETAKGSTPLEAIMEVSKQSMLSGIPTTLKIVLGNTFQMARQQAAHNLTAARLFVTNDPMKKVAWDAAMKSNMEMANATVSEAVASLKTSLTMLKEIYQGKYTSRFEAGYRITPAATSQALGIENRMGAELVDFAGGVSRVASAGPIIVDKWSDGVAHAQQLNYLAPIAAYEKGLTGEAARAFEEKILQGPIEPKLPSVKSPANLAKYENDLVEFREIQKVWDDVKQYRDWVKQTQDPDGLLGKMYEGIKSDKVQGTPFLRMMSPFLRAKVNMIQDSLNSIGIAPFLTETNKAILAAGGSKAEMLKSKLIVGNSLLTLGAIGGFTSTMRGKGSIQSDVTKQMNEAGIKSNSAGNILELDYAGTTGKILSLGADVGKAFQYIGTGIMDKKWETDLQGAALFIMASVGQNLLLDDPITDILVNTTSGNERATKDAASQLSGAAGSVAPIPGLGLLRSIRNEVDPYKRETGKMSEAIDNATVIIAKFLNQIPGASKLMPQALDSLGYPMLNTGGIGVARAVNEFTPDQIEKNKTIKGMMKLGYGTAPVTPELEQAQPLLKFNPHPHNLSLANGASIPFESYAQRNEFILRSLGKAKPEEKGEVEKMIQGILDSRSTDGSKVMRIKDIVSAYRSKAKAEMLMAHPELMRKYKEYLSQYGDSMTGDPKLDTVVQGE